MNSIFAMVAKRIALSLVTLFVISVLIFVGVEALPGDLAEAILGQNALPETVAAFRKEPGENMVAMAMAGDPDIIIFDEPTTALDVTTQIEVLAAIKEIVKQRNTAAIYISHDLAIVAQMADRISLLTPDIR